MYIVKFEFKRIQTFLFSSSRLKDMVGANALLGNLLRQALPQLAIEHGAQCSDFPSSATLSQLDDPLTGSQQAWFNDQPDHYWRQGILSRDGGHFYASFASEDELDQFVAAARDTIINQIPEVRVSYQKASLRALETTQGFPDTGTTLIPHPVPPLPIFQPCQFSGNGIAQHAVATPDRQTLYVSDASYQKARLSIERTKETTRSADVASILMHRFQEETGKAFANDLDELVGSDYLALIATDGNNMGRRLSAWLKRPEDQPLNWLQKQAQIESFFHQVRVALRLATWQACNTHFATAFRNKKLKHLPFHILMLGGDDLLLACRAKDALPLVEKINDALAHIPLADDQPMSLGAGVCIASHNLPFHRLRLAAEALSSSAKTRSRDYSVVDWSMVTQSWIDDPIAARRQNDVVRYRVTGAQEETLLLTAKPYALKAATGKKTTPPATPDQANANPEPDTDSPQSPSPQSTSLAELLSYAHAIHDAIIEESADPNKQQVARSQLRYLQGEIGRGKRHAQYVWDNLPPHLSQTLTELTGHSDLPWHSLGGSNVFQTLLIDLIELIEIQYLQRAER